MCVSQSISLVERNETIFHSELSLQATDDCMLRSSEGSIFGLFSCSGLPHARLEMSDQVVLL